MITEQKFIGIKGKYILLIALVCAIIVSTFLQPFCSCQYNCVAGAVCPPCTCSTPLGVALPELTIVSLILTIIATLIIAGIKKVLKK